MILIGTYWDGQFKKWKGYYNYPISDADKVEPEKINELWLFNGNKQQRTFTAEFVGIKTRKELVSEYKYPAKGSGHGDKYLLFRIKRRLQPSRKIDRSFIRLKDFAKRSPKVVAQLKQFLASTPEGRDAFLRVRTSAALVKSNLPRIVTSIPKDKLIVGEAALQMDFLNSFSEPGVAVPFPPPDRGAFTFVDLFAGVGGIRMGFQNVGGKCVFSSEWNAAAAETYQRNFGEVPHGDIQKINENDVPDHDVLCAGFPCQPFSISGLQKGFDDIRGTMFFELCRIVKRKRPRIVFLENVKHLVHHDHGRTLQVILNTLKDLGYNVVWKVLNGVDFGVPQNRERIIIIGTHNRSFNFDALKREPRKMLLECLDKGGDFEFLDPSEYTLLENPRRQEESGLIFAGYRNKSIRKVGVRPGTLHLSRVHKQPNRIYSVLGIHPTLPSQESSGRYFIRLENDQVRKLTLQECWRIMGFPENYIKVSAPGEQYRQLGNSVCVPMITAVAAEIKKQLLKE